MTNKFHINKDIRKAKTLHSDFYKDQIIFDKFKKDIFLHSWQFFLHRKQIKHKASPGIFMPDLISEPFVLTQDNNQIDCLSNICTHRGHMVCNNSKNTKSLTCRYHGRTFNLDGTMKNAPGFDDALNFPSKTDNLMKFNIKNWMDFIFISLKDSMHIDSALNDIESRLVTFPFKELSFSESLSNEFEIDVHWAIYCENYLEGFHVPFVHKGLSKEISNDTYETVLLKNGCVQYAKSYKSEEIYGYYYWIFPNMMFNFYNWGLSINIVEPISINKTRIKFLSYPILNDKHTSKEVEDLIRVEKEDQMVVNSVQKGIESIFYDRGRYSPTHEKGVHHFHRILSRYF
mgnify:CR=1 FL=1|tara:strand:+ start:120 stop:1151 length:1032 start_codon:yes stop_codon:yes gene_type:complete